MKGIGVIFKKEIKTYFNSPIAYIFIVVFLGLSYFLFIDQYFLAGRNEMRSFFHIISLFFLIFVPAITMRLWSEERKMGTIELLLTLPITKPQLVAGKYFAAVFFLVVALIFSMPIPVMMFMLGNPDIGPIMGGYIGTLFLGCQLIAIGMFLSTLCKDQIVAFILSLIVCLALYIVGLPFMTIMLEDTIPGVGKFLQNYIAIPPHYESIQRGVIELRDFLYFTIMSLTFYILTIYYLEGHIRVQSKGSLITLIVLILTSCTFSNMIVSDVYGYRLDFTKDKVYTISEGTKKIMNAIKTPVNINYYVTSEEKMPAYLATLERDVTDVLKDLSTLSDNVNVNVFYPDKDAKVMEMLSEWNIQTYRIGSIEQFESVEKLVNSAIRIEYFDRKPEVVNGVFPDDIAPSVNGVGISDLEYMVASRLYRLTKAERPVVAVVGPYEEFDFKRAEMLMKMGLGPSRVQNDDPYSRVTEALREALYDVRRIRLDSKQQFPEEKLDAIIVFSPKEQQLNKRQLYEINRKLSEGVNVILALSGVALEFDLGFSGRVTLRNIKAEKINEEAIKWLDGLGIKMEHKFLMNTNIVTDYELIQRTLGPIQFEPERVRIEHPTNFKLLPEKLNKNHPIVERLNFLYYIKGSPLSFDRERLSSNGINYTVLSETTDDSWIKEFKETLILKTDFGIPSDFEGSIPVIALFEGQFPFEYQGEGVPSWSGEGAGSDQAPIQQKPAKLIVVSSGSMFSDKYVVSREEEYDNLSLLLSSVDYLTGSHELTQIRTKNVKPDQIEQLTPQQKMLYKVGFGIAGPLMVIALGIARYFKRLKKRRRYFEALQRQKK